MEDHIERSEKLIDMLRTPTAIRRKRSGHTLLEAMFAVFLALACALIFAATVPVANTTRGKAEFMNSAVSLAQKTAEVVRSGGYPNTQPDRLYANKLIDSLTEVSISSYPFGSAGEKAYECSNIDNNLVDSPSRVLPNGKGFVQTSQVNIDLRQVTVIIAWQENSEWKSVRLSTLVANL